jgi:hypothetical protein
MHTLYTVHSYNTGVKDDLWYLISAWNYGHTQTHLDHGCQTVLYHVLAGDNIFVGCPRKLGAVIWALHNKLGDRHLARVRDLEMWALEYALTKQKLQYGEFGAGQSLLILPAAAHAGELTAVSGN